MQVSSFDLGWAVLLFTLSPGRIASWWEGARVQWEQGVTKRCRLSLLTNSAPHIQVQMRGGGVARSQPMSTAVHITWHGAQINFGDKTPYLTFEWEVSRVGRGPNCLMDWIGRAPDKWGTPQISGARPERVGRSPNCLIDCSGRAPKGVWQNGEEVNLLIQHTVFRWCSSDCVHEGCDGVDRWLQTEDQLPRILFYTHPGRQTSTACLHSSTCWADAVFLHSRGISRTVVKTPYMHGSLLAWVREGGGEEEVSCAQKGGGRV